MWIALIVLAVLFIVVSANREVIIESDILIKLAIFSVMIGCIGIIGEEFINGSYIVTVISSILFLMCIVTGIFRIIFGSDIGTTGRLIIFFTFLGLVFEELARLNNVLHIGIEYVSFMINGRNVSIMIIMLVLFIKSFKMIFSKKDEKNSYIESGE